MANSPLVSVIITVYNRQELISEAINSVLRSDYQHFELIIVDDFSTDNTVAIAKSLAAQDHRVQVHANKENLGDYPNRNYAASHAQGKYLKYVDSDDCIYPHTLRIMVDAMEKFSTAAFGFCDTKPQEIKRLPRFFTGEQALREHFFNKGLLLAGPSSSIIRRDCFEKIGGFSSARYIGDYQAWLTLCLQFDVVLLPPNLVNIRLHPGQELDVGKLAYYHLNYNLHKSFIKSPEFPFSDKDRKKLLYNYKVLLSRRIYQRLLKWFGITKTLETIRKAGESPAIFLWAFLPMKKLYV